MKHSWDLIWRQAVSDFCHYNDTTTNITACYRESKYNISSGYWPGRGTVDLKKRDCLKNVSLQPPQLLVNSRVASVCTQLT